MLSGLRQGAVTDKQGEFALKGLDRALVFHVLVVAEGYAPLGPDADPAKGPMAIRLNRHDLDNRAAGFVLRGRVLHGDRPVKNATVRAFGMRTENGGRRLGGFGNVIDPLAVSNERGEFRMSVAEKDAAFLLEVKGAFLAPVRLGPLQAGATVHDIKLVAGVTVKGRVVKDGKPLPGITMLLMPHAERPMFSKFDRIATGPDGVFEFRNVPPDRDAHIFGMMESCAPHGVLAARPVRIGASGSTVDLGDLAVLPGHRIAGRLIVDDGKPVPPQTRVTLTLFSKDVDFADAQFLEVAPDGVIKFAGLAAGQYRLEVKAKGYRLSPKNQSYESYPRLAMSHLTGRVDRDLKGLRILLEPDSTPLPAAAKRGLSPKERVRRLDAPLQGLGENPVKEAAKGPLFPLRGDKDNALEAAREAANAIEKINQAPVERIDLWCAVANVFHDLGDDKSALVCVDQAYTTIDEWRILGNPFRGVAAAYGRLGNTEAIAKLLALSKQIMNPKGKQPKTALETVILRNAAASAAQAGHPREAEKLADLLTDAEARTALKALLRRYAVTHQAQSGDVAGAIRAALESPSADEKIGRLVGDGFMYVMLNYDDFNDMRTPWAGIAHAQLAQDDKAGARETALRALRLLPDVTESRKTRMSATIVQVLARANDVRVGPDSAGVLQGSRGETERLRPGAFGGEGIRGGRHGADRKGQGCAGAGRRLQAARGEGLPLAMDRVGPGSCRPQGRRQSPFRRGHEAPHDRAGRGRHSAPGVVVLPGVRAGAGRRTGGGRQADRRAAIGRGAKGADARAGGSR